MHQVHHQRVHFHKAVGNRRTCHKDNPLTTGDLIQVSALHEHIFRLLCRCRRQTSYISHLGIEEAIFIKMALIYDQLIYAQLFKGDHVILLCIIVKFFKPYLQGALHLLHLFDCEILTALVLHLVDCLYQVVNLPLYDVNLS